MRTSFVECRSLMLAGKRNALLAMTELQHHLWPMPGGRLSTDPKRKVNDGRSRQLTYINTPAASRFALQATPVTFVAGNALQTADGNSSSVALLVLIAVLQRGAETA